MILTHIGGTVTINSTNPLDQPLINPNYLSHPQDVAIMQYAAASAQKFVTAPVWDGYILDSLTSTTVDDFRNGAHSLFHPVGTASMSPAGADWGVVDPDLKLKGAKGVRIVDASVIVCSSAKLFLRADLSSFIDSRSCQQGILRRLYMSSQRGQQI